MKRRYVFLFIALILGSFVCFLHPSFHASKDWVLFLLLFTITAAVLGTQVRKAPQRFRERVQILDALQEGVVLLNGQGLILKINLKAAQLFGGGKSDFLGRHFLDFELLKKNQELWKRCTETLMPQSLTFCLDREEKKCCDMVVKPLGNSGRFILTLRDSFRQYQQHQLGKDFVANASHELRTPITIIKGFAETIHDLPEISGAMLQDFTKKIVRNCQRMDNLVKNLLTLTDLDYLPQARLQECDLVALVDNCSHTLLALYPDVSIELLQSKKVITLPADPDLLELALMNLLENAVKYSKAPASITITIEDSPEKVALTIADKGVGIAEHDLDHIFDRFYTVDKAHSRKLGGAGLGLSIVKAIIAKHDGSIAAGSRLGSGTEFSLIFQKVTQSVL
ncbi:MAG: Alkaline phosphatase synthesis sensor protein PhoR [Chlamydiae bacterium]|nr:Alkaline phosphatase synthesis sensor protein PhoR [Chlamydiota bacterium]